MPSAKSHHHHHPHRIKTMTTKRKRSPSKTGRIIFWVKYSSVEGWTVSKGSVLMYRFDGKAEAVEEARMFALEVLKRGGIAQVRVMKKNGRFHYENTYGKDPRSRKG
jgi:hypothetical protein